MCTTMAPSRRRTGGRPTATPQGRPCTTTSPPPAMWPSTTRVWLWTTILNELTVDSLHGYMVSTGILMLIFLWMYFRGKVFMYNENFLVNLFLCNNFCIPVLSVKNYMTLYCFFSEWKRNLFSSYVFTMFSYRKFSQ